MTRPAFYHQERVPDLEPYPGLDLSTCIRLPITLTIEDEHIGSDFDDFLTEQSLLEEVSATALKRVIAWQLASEIKRQKLTKKALAERMHTSRSPVARALDTDDVGMTLATLANAARALGQRVEIQLAPEDEAACA